MSELSNPHDWERDEQDKKRRLAPIIPLVVYHGRRRWRVATDFGELFPGPEALRPYWPAFRYELQDLGRYQDDEIIGAVWERMALLLMKHIFDPRLHEYLPAIFTL